MTSLALAALGLVLLVLGLGVEDRRALNGWPSGRAVAALTALGMGLLLAAALMAGKEAGL